MTEFDYDALHRRMYAACVQLYGNVRWCTLCSAKLPSRSQYNSHLKGSNHCRNANEIYDQLMNKFSSPGIVLEADNIYCLLCQEDVGCHRFNSTFYSHIQGWSHQCRVNTSEENFSNSQFGTYFDNFPTNVYEHIFNKGITRATSFINTHQELHCGLCNCRLPGESQFLSHTRGSSHLNEVAGQLMKIADKAGLYLGIIVENGSFVCKLCNVVVGAELNAYGVHEHLDSFHHQKNHEEQINCNIYAFDNESSDSESGSYESNNSNNGYYESMDESGSYVSNNSNDGYYESMDSQSSTSSSDYYY